MSIPIKLSKAIESKQEMAKVLETTGQSTKGVPFRDYTTLIENIPNLSSMTQEEINSINDEILSINGEKA